MVAVAQFGHSPSVACGDTSPVNRGGLRWRATSTPILPCGAGEGDHEVVEGAVLRSGSKSEEGFLE